MNEAGARFAVESLACGDEGLDIDACTCGELLVEDSSVRPNPDCEGSVEVDDTDCSGSDDSLGSDLTDESDSPLSVVSIEVVLLAAFVEIDCAATGR